MKLTKTQEYIIMAVAGVLGLVFVFYQFVIKPLDANIVALQSQLEQKQKDLDSAKQMVAKYDEFKKESAQTTRELDWAQSRLPSQLDKAQIVENINTLQAKSGVSLTSFRFETIAPSKATDYTEIPAILEFDANFDQLMAFLYEVSLSKNLMVVKDLIIKPYTANEDPDSDQTLSAQLVLNSIQGKKQ